MGKRASSLHGALMPDFDGRVATQDENWVDEYRYAPQY